jgi:hypothetical protein
MDAKIDAIARKKERPNVLKDFYNVLDRSNAELQLYLTTNALYIMSGGIFELTLNTLAKSLNRFLHNQVGRYEKQQIKIRKLQDHIYDFIIERNNVE